ncbi:hypothetical protein CNR22_11925 [Sphingobacteriaceae bacterium]|nr:hypothetical protein CNR22_11925 [Sphingobacteriaceae bacterium]
MKTLLFFSLTYFIVSDSLKAQRSCATPLLPQQFETWVQSITPKPGKYGSANVQSVFNIPVIVHIIHDNEAVNSISATSGNNLNAAQVIDQINILNKDFNGTNADTNLIPSVFKPLLGKFQVNFCLAVVNPTGGIMAEPGIDRINRVSKGWNALPYSKSYVDATVKANSIWNTNQYLNVWVLPLGSGLLGYATFPNPGTSGIAGLGNTFGSATTDGVVILNTSFGSIGTAQSGSYNKGRTVTHEIGHWVGLRHVWGDANCGTDYCNDTPPAQTANFGCPTYPFNSGTCTGNTTGEMTMNFMDYTDDACMQMFTADQKYRAQLILSNSPMRVALVTSTVCNLPTASNDIGISFVSKPIYSETVSCINYIDPVINVTNYGSNTITTALFSFNVDGVATQTLGWTGTVAPNASFTLALTQITGLNLGSHLFNVSVSAPNAGVDNNLSNNSNQQQFSIVTNSFVFTAPSATICHGTPAVVTASGATSYTWSSGPISQSVSLNPSVTTIYTVTAGLGSCVMTKTVKVTVLASPVISIDKTHVCEGTASTITAAGANTYTWSSGENTPDIEVILSANSTFTLKAKSTSTCVTTEIYTISVDPLPTATLTTSYVSCGNCSDGTVYAMASGGTGPYSYLWEPGASTSETLTGVGAGCYKVMITDNLGCKTVDSACVSFNTGLFNQTLPGSLFTANPNPSEGLFTFNFSDAGSKSIIITDALGKLIKNYETNSETLLIDLNVFDDGIYYARIVSGASQSVIKLLKK